MKIPFLDLKLINKPIETQLKEAILQTVDSGWFIGGEPVEKFENAFTDYIGTTKCVSCGSGTDALELILQGYGIGPGDEVILPSFTWISDAEAVINVGAMPVFADINSSGYNLSFDDVESKITSKTKAIIIVHLFGIVCDPEPFISLSRKHSLKLIEDCAQAHGATFKSKKAGNLGDAAAFSFYPTKNLGALGDGGAITTNDNKLADQIRLLTNHGQIARDVHQISGRNSRLDTIQASILSVKLNYLEQWNEKRAELAKIYLKELSNSALDLPDLHKTSAYHLFVVRSYNRDALKTYLEENGIETAIHYPTPIHQMKPFIKEYNPLENAEKASKEVLSLPCNPAISSDQAQYLVDVIKRF